MRRYAIRCLALACVASATYSARAADWNLDGLSDIWGYHYNATNLNAALDSDGDGVPNWAESIAGTDPLNADSFHAVLQTHDASNRAALVWYGLRGKRYDILARSNLLDAAWNTHAVSMGSNRLHHFPIPEPQAQPFFWSVQVADVDSDGDGLSDYEEYLIGLNPFTNRSHRTVLNDSNKVRNAFRATNWVSVAAIDPVTHEAWPDAGVFAIRRTGRIDRITVPFTISGSATLNLDYTLSTNGSITLEPGVREAWVHVHPLPDAVNELDETVVLTLGTSAWYRLGPSISATVTIANAVFNLPSPKAAARFLTQVTFGPRTQDIASVTAIGFNAWLTNQFALPPSFHSSFMHSVTSAYTDVYADHKILAWWERAMHAPDQLRQRMAWALSQILVVSDNNDTLGNDWPAMIGYYDMLVGHAFGNYRDLLLAVTLHPAMGVYLSHFQNMVADPALGRFPDENFAREVMQLFSIGLWELNPDGTQILTNGLPIPTYGNADITELARVFTGLSWPTGNTNLWWEFFWPGDGNYSFNGRMRMWQVYHDTNTKVLLRGTVLPAGQPGMKDVSDAIDNLVNHPSAGPFLAKLLIQRFTTSNPGTGYVARVAAAFADNGLGVRGDLRAVLTAILMDPEARDPAWLDIPTEGKLKEPYLRAAQMARAFNAAASNNFYEMWWLQEVLGMAPYRSPSVFSFYLPTYQPGGAIRDAGLVAPEFQITTATTGITVPNHMLWSVFYGMNRWPFDPPTDVKMNFDPWVPLAGNPDALLRGLDLLLTGGNLPPAKHQILREALERIPASDTTTRVQNAVYLIGISPEFAVQK
ncbi:MAG TPA: DUF1800 family protein [Kiritimatiellia bacterium]|nr:DUF1800 family protein [Kiritimatiellia bacterium]